MSDQDPKRLIPWADPELPGDLPPPLDMWLEGETDYVDLPPENQRAARLILNQDGDKVQRLNGTERTVRFLPGDYFTGVDSEWLLDRLVLSPKAGRIHTSPYEDTAKPTCFLGGAEIDPWGELGEFPLGPGSGSYGSPIVTIGRDSLMDPDLVAATLYERSPWLISEWIDVHTDYIPIPTNEMGEESEYRMTHEAWSWVVEMTATWTETRAEHDLPIVSEFLADDDELEVMLEYVAEAAQGGKGVVTFNGTVIYWPKDPS